MFKEAIDLVIYQRSGLKATTYIATELETHKSYQNRKHCSTLKKRNRLNTIYVVCSQPIQLFRVGCTEILRAKGEFLFYFLQIYKMLSDGLCIFRLCV